jgi:hypothetical protein
MARYRLGARRSHFQLCIQSTLHETFREKQQRILCRRAAQTRQGQQQSVEPPLPNRGFGIEIEAEVEIVNQHAAGAAR